MESPELSNILQEILITLILAVVPVIASVLGLLLRRWLMTAQSKLAAELSTEELLIIQQLAYATVSAAEQLYQSNSHKKAWAINSLSQQASKVGINLDADDLNLLIEAAVNGLSKGYTIGLTPPAE